MSQRITYFSPVIRHFGGSPQKYLSNFLFGMRLSNLICGFRNAKMSQSVSISSLTPYVYQEMSQQPNLSLPSWSEFDAIMSQPFNPTQPNRPKSTQATCKSVSESTSQPNMSLPSWREEMVRVITPLRADNLEVVPILTENYKETFMVWCHVDKQTPQSLQAFVLSEQEETVSAKRREIKGLEGEIQELKTEIRRREGMKRRLQEEIYKLNKQIFCDEYHAEKWVCIQ